MKEYTRASQLFYLEVVGAALQDCHRYSLEGTKRKASSPVLAWLSDVLPFVLETIVLGGAQRTRTADFCVGKAGSGQPPRKLTARERTRQDVCDRLREDLRPPNFALRDAWRRRAADFLDKLIGLANGPGLPPHGDLCQLVAPLLRAPHMEAMDVFLIDSAKRDIYKDDKQMMQQSQAQTPMQTGGAAQTPQDTGIGMEGQDAGEKGFGDTGRGGDGGGGGEGGPPSEDREEGDEEGRMRGASQGAVSVLRRGTEAESGMDGKDGERDDTAPPSEDETDGHERGGRRQTGGGAVRVVRVQGGPGRGGGDRGPGGRRGRFSVTQRSRSGTEVSDGEMSKGSRRGWKARISSLGGESRDRRRSRRASSRSPGGKRRARLSRSALSVEHRQRDASVADLLASRHALADLHSEDEEVSDGFRIRKGTDGSWEEDDSARTGSEVDEEPLPPPPVAAMESLEREMRGKRPTKTGGRMDRSPKGTVENLLTSHGKKVAYHVQPAENLPADEEANPRGPATPPPVSAPFPSQQQQAAKGGSVERRDISASPHGVPQGPSLQGVGRLQSALASSLEVRGPSVLSHGVERPFQNQNQFQQGEPPLLSPSSPPLGEESPMRTTHQDPGYVSGVIQQRAEALASRTVEKMQADVTVALDKKHQEMTAALGRADRAEKELEQARATIHFLQKTLKDTKQELAAQAVESSLQQRMEYQSVGYGSNALFSPSSPPSPSMLFQTGGGTHAGADALLFTPERAPLPPFTSSPPRAARVPSNSLHSPGVLHPASFHPRARGDSPLKPSPISASVAGSVPLPSSPSRHLGLRPDADLHAPGRFLSMYGGGSAAYDASFGASRVGGGRI
uniref:Uncharacterized protein n=1 Tax=Chromera velia CCMP2878 TaxID=1169474 RepID=A0A0G4IEU8_9ALVE|eukprot:Cvel_13824.t1-p1 / transcript=Cvel_13824.t1 / gene=Cvel_13824 / organism=Chromera_velia_CCMP2878 / gene_product=hypothetical protein / transcript_product=hypothetical protein / location=Cvel_scaffold960:9-5883(+) / protein_length=848 / sequence_SO=supercontig / SO=protein_coding / is_pseudo=false